MHIEINTLKSGKERNRNRNWEASVVLGFPDIIELCRWSGNRIAFTQYQRGKETIEVVSAGTEEITIWAWKKCSGLNGIWTYDLCDSYSNAIPLNYKAR